MRHTPVGTLRQRQQHSPPSFSWGYIEHAVKTVDDLKVLRYIMEHRQARPCPERVAQIDRDYADFGVPIIAVPGSPITELNKTWMGVMEMCYLLADEPCAGLNPTETERLLRSKAPIYDVSIEPVAYHDGIVDILVTTHDTWTLQPGISFSRTGATKASNQRSCGTRSKNSTRCGSRRLPARRIASTSSGIRKAIKAGSPRRSAGAIAVAASLNALAAQRGDELGG